MFGAVRTARALGAALVAEALPRGTEALDRAAASRRALLVTFQLAILLLAGIPLAAVTQPFVRFPVVLIVVAGRVVPYPCPSGGARRTCTATCGPGPR